MNKISVMGLDLAKIVFQVHGVDKDGEVAVRFPRCFRVSRPRFRARP
jgi:uncharacterized C2H2 Zn-finger protein